MAQILPSRTPLCCWRSLMSDLSRQLQPRRSLVTVQRGKVPKLEMPQDLPEQFWSQMPTRFRPDHGKRKIIIHEAPPSTAQACKDPIKVVEARQIAALDPTGARSRLFDPENRDRAKVGDTLHVTFKTGEPFSGVLMSIKSRGPLTSVLLRNHLTKVGTEMLIKVHSPLVQSMEVAQRTVKRKRRARLYYLRKPEHDVGSVQKVVDQYLRQKASLTGGGRSKSQYGSTKTKGNR